MAVTFESVWEFCMWVASSVNEYHWCLCVLQGAMTISERPTTHANTEDLQRSLFTSVSSVGSDGEQDAFDTASSDSSEASIGDLLGDKRWNPQGNSLQGLGQISSVLPPSRSYSVDLSTPSQPPMIQRPLQQRVSISGPLHQRECAIEQIAVVKSVFVVCL